MPISQQSLRGKGTTKCFKYKSRESTNRQQNVSAMAGFGVLITFGFFI
jgi:hypothetical protein